MTTVPDDAGGKYYFDAEAADRPVRFVEKLLAHYKGRFAGQPFLLHPTQKQIIRDVYGWKHTDTGLRRFDTLYIDGAVGSGKSPLLAALGLYSLVAEGEPGAEVYSLAKTFSQARIVFDCAKLFIKHSPALASRLQVRFTEIRHVATGSVWKIVSGKGPGAGCNPSMIIGDEVHDWVSGEAYYDLRDRMSKRQQPLAILATNAGKSQASLCWQLREKTVAAIEGHGDPGLYGVIWAADDDAATEDPAAWRQANPLLGVTIAEEKVRAKAAEAVKDEQEEAEFRRLYLGIWPKRQADRWIDLSLWDAAADGQVSPADSPVFSGLDLSQSDDMCAAVWVRVTPDRMFVDSHFWMPRVTAEKYVRRDSIPYLEWADAGHITLLDEPTVSNAAMQAIAAEVIARSGRKKPEAVCYDRFKADIAIRTLEAAGVACVPIAQGYSLSPGCNELDRRLKEGSITIAANPVMRFCAENVQVKRDGHDGLWPVKPGAEDGREGLRSKKIDGISATVTALVQARKHVFPVRKPNPRVIAL